MYTKSCYNYVNNHDTPHCSWLYMSDWRPSVFLAAKQLVVLYETMHYLCIYISVQSHVYTSVNIMKTLNRQIKDLFHTRNNSLKIN